MTKGVVLRVVALILIIMVFSFILFLVAYAMQHIDEPTEMGKLQLFFFRRINFRIFLLQISFCNYFSVGGDEMQLNATKLGNSSIDVHPKDNQWNLLKEIRELF